MPEYLVDVVARVRALPSRKDAAEPVFQGWIIEQGFTTRDVGGQVTFSLEQEVRLEADTAAQALDNAPDKAGLIAALEWNIISVEKNSHLVMLLGEDHQSQASPAR
jgi:hypothetical protein